MFKYFYFLQTICIFTYYILVDIFIHHNYDIFKSFKIYYINRLARLYYVDILFRQIYGKIGKYLILNKNKSLNTYSRCLNFSSYDYLGINEMKLNPNDYLNLDIKYTNDELKNTISDFLAYKYIILSNTGYATNAIYTKLMCDVPNYLIIIDQYIHNSSIVGSKNLNKKIFKHNDLNHLETLLKTHPNNQIFVFIEGLYSMHGHCINIPNLIELKNKYKFKLVVDEAHSFCSVGKNGKGVFNLYYDDVSKYIDIYVATFSKTCNANGGFIATNDFNIYSRLQSQPIDYIHAISAKHITKSIKYVISDQGKENLEYIHILSKYLYEKLKQNGNEVFSDEYSPVQCINIGYGHQGATFSRYALDNNLAITVVGYPAANMFSLTLRICISKYHTKSDIDYLISVINNKPFKNYINQEFIDNDIIKYKNINSIQDVIKYYGIGTSGPTAFYGSLKLIRDIEQEIANKYGYDSCIIISGLNIGLPDIKQYCKLNNLRLVDLTNKEPSSVPKDKLDCGFINIEQYNRENCQGIIFLGNKTIISNSYLQLNSYVFTATLPAYVYYSIKKIFIE
jgi:7-keto-8-aminopelargonate synthetase-like enzyme